MTEVTTERLVPETVTLAFRPDEADVSFRRVWADPLARLLWVAWRWKHIVDKNFDDECLVVAEGLRGGAVAKALGYRSNFRCSSAMTFMEQFAPILRGEQAISVTYPGRFGWNITEELLVEPALGAREAGR